MKVLLGRVRAVSRAGSAVCFLLVASGAHAQDTLIVSSTPRCTECSVTFERIATLGDASDPDGSRGGFPLVAVSSTRFLVADMGMNHVIVYDRDGRYAGTIGHAGDGPGEFRSIGLLIVDAADSLFVFDHGHRRLTVFAPDDSVVRTERMPPLQLPMSAVRFPDRDWVVGSMIYAGEETGYPLHHVRDGQRVRAFGAEVPHADPNQPWADQRLVAIASDRSVWSTRPDRYLLEEWSLDGSSPRALRRDAQWFNPEDGGATELSDIRRLENGLLAVICLVPDSDGTHSHTFEDARTSYDTVVELLDPATGTLVVSGRTDEYVSGFAGEGLVYSHRPDATGQLLIDIFRIRLTGF